MRTMNQVKRFAFIFFVSKMIHATLLFYRHSHTTSGAQPGQAGMLVHRWDHPSGPMAGQGRAVGCWRQGAGKVRKLMCFFTESKCQRKFSANHRMGSPEVKQDSSGHGYTHIASRPSVWGLPPQTNYGGVSMAPVCHSGA